MLADSSSPFYLLLSPRFGWTGFIDIIINHVVREVSFDTRIVPGDTWRLVA